MKTRSLVALLVASLFVAAPGCGVARSQSTAVVDLAPGAGQSLGEAYPVPDGALRIPRDAFGEWLGRLEVLDPSVPVRTWDGQVVEGHRARVVALPLVPGDLQQCADSLIRLRAEWLREAGRPVVFHATSGDAIPFARWEAGERPYEAGSRLKWRRGPKGGWDDYLAAVFTWAGTRSLAFDTDPAGEPRAGDILVLPGSPGHAVALLDVARRGDETLVLVGEGFMPAQSFHVEIGPVGGWWVWGPGMELPSYDMRAAALRRWK